MVGMLAGVAATLGLLILLSRGPDQAQPRAEPARRAVHKPTRAEPEAKPAPAQAPAKAAPALEPLAPPDAQVQEDAAAAGMTSRPSSQPPAPR